MSAAPISLLYTVVFVFVFFWKLSLPFLMVDATIGNQAFSHDECNMFPGLSYNKAE